MSKIMGLIRLIRPVNSLMSGFTVIVGELIVSGNVYPLVPSFLAFITAFTLMATSMVINDYCDRLVDAVNAPRRPIPSGLVSGKEALIYATILSGIGLTAALLTSPSCLFLALVSLSVSVLYNTRGKETGLIGNLMVSSCVAIPVVYGGLIRSEPMSESGFRLLVISASMAFLSNTGREVTKGISDVEGDRVRNVNTVAILFGSRSAAVLSVVFYLSAVVLTAMPWLWGLVSPIYVPIIGVADLGLAFSSLLLLHNHSRENAKKVKGTILVWMMIGLLAFMAGGRPTEGA